MGSSKISPQVHKFKEKEVIVESDTILVVDNKGEKFKKLLIPFLKKLLISIYDRLDKLESPKDIVVSKAAVLKAFERSKSVNFGKPFNIRASNSVEKRGVKGDIYCTDSKVRVKLGNKWHTIYDNGE